VWNASFSQNGKWTVTAAGLPDAKARVLETSSGSMLAELGENAHPVRNAFFDPTGGFVLTTSSGKDSNARIWRWSEGTFVELRRHEDQVLWAAFSPDATKVVTTSRDGTARVWDVRSGEPIRSLHHGGIVWRASFSPDGKMLAVARGNATKVWRVSTWNVEHQLENPEIFDILFCPNSRFVLALSTDDTATVLHLNTGQRTALYGHTNRLYSGDFSPNGRLIATASADGTVRLYELVTS
jgi:WD40 repeat protein